MTFTQGIFFLFVVSAVAYPNEETPKVMSWDATEIEFSIPKNYPENVVIFSVQVLQLPDYPIGSDVAQAVCNRPQKYSGMRRPNWRDKRNIIENQKERRRKKESFMGIVDSPRSNQGSRNVRKQDKPDNRRKDRITNRKSQANIYRRGGRFKLLKNPKNLFTLLYDTETSLMSLALQRPLTKTDYVHINEHSVEVTIAMRDECGKEKSRRQLKQMYSVKLHIMEPFQCLHPTEKMCMLPASDIYLRQWENREPSPLLVLPSLQQFCPQLRRQIRVKMKDLKQKYQPELTYNERQNSFYHNVTLDRELRDSFLFFDVSCIIKGAPDYTGAHQSSSGLLFIEDENDSPPIASRDINVVWEVKFLEGSTKYNTNTHELSNMLFVVDPDLMDSNDILLHIEGLDWKDDTVQQSLIEFPVSTEGCRNETSRLTSPLKANCTIMNPELFFNDYIFLMNQTSINFALVFRDNSLLNSNGNNEVKYNITILLTENKPGSVQKFDPNSDQGVIDTNITVSRPVQKYARLGKIFQPYDTAQFPISSFPQFELSPGSTDKGVAVTPLSGILYISNPTLLADNLDGQNALGITVKIRSKMVKKLFLSWANFVCPRKNMGTCAKHLYKDDCRSSCGLGSRTNCQWRPLKGTFKTSHYATCSPEVATCPDGLCDELESLDEMICPQDCIDSTKVKSKNSNVHKSDRSSQQRGISHGFGVCNCDDFCQCFPVNTNKSVHLPSKNPKRKNIGEGNGASYTCDASCQIGIGCFLLICFIVTIFICRRRKDCGGKYKGDAGRSSNNGEYFDDYSSSYASGGPVHGEVHAMALHGIRNNSPRQNNNNNQELLSDMALPNYSIDKKWEFPRSQLIVEKTLGEGEFGRVMKAKAYEIDSVPGSSVVAVKMLKGNSTAAELADLLSEFDLLKEVSNPNVIRLLGACTTKGGPVYLIMEFCKYGSLRTYLRRSRHFELESSVGAADIEEPGIDYHVTPKDLLSFLWQICKGMTYLTNMKLVHRDLAARNILLAEGKVCKISDFGLTRDIYEGDLYLKRSKGRVPVKWMAPESLADHVYTHKSDVWSFGILLWELVTLGSSPYPGVTPERMFSLLKSGYRMEKPDNCSVELYKVMKDCWEETHERRPTFSQLTHAFERMIQADVDYLELRSLIVTNRMYFNEDTSKLDCKDDDTNRTNESSIADVGSCDKEDRPTIDKDNYLFATSAVVPTFPPMPMNPRTHAHNPAYAAAACDPSGSPTVDYPVLLDVSDEEEDAKVGLVGQQGPNQCEWDSDSGRATGDSGYITGDNKKLLGSNSASVHGAFSKSLKLQQDSGYSRLFPYKTDAEMKHTTDRSCVVNGYMPAVQTTSPSISGGSNRISSSSSLRDEDISPDSLANTPKVVKRSPIIV